MNAHEQVVPVAQFDEALAVAVAAHENEKRAVDTCKEQMRIIETLKADNVQVRAILAEWEVVIPKLAAQNEQHSRRVRGAFKLLKYFRPAAWRKIEKKINAAQAKNPNLTQANLLHMTMTALPADLESEIDSVHGEVIALARSKQARSAAIRSRNRPSPYEPELPAWRQKAVAELARDGRATVPAIANLIRRDTGTRASARLVRGWLREQWEDLHVRAEKARNKLTEKAREQAELRP